MPDEEAQSVTEYDRENSDIFEWIYSPEAWVVLATLTALEIVLGIDNVIFISIVAGRLPAEETGNARDTSRSEDNSAALGSRTDAATRRAGYTGGNHSTRFVHPPDDGNDCRSETSLAACGPWAIP